MPQIQIMRADLPHTLYRKGKGGKKRGSVDDYKYNPKDPAIAKTEESIRRRKERMAQESGYSVDELFNKE